MTRDGPVFRPAVGKIRGPILVPLAIAACVFMATVVGGVSWLVTRENAQRVERIQRQAETLLGADLKESGDTLLLALRGIVRERRFTPMLRDGDRKRLAEDLTPFFAELRALHHVSHLYVMNPDRVVMLRAHDPGLAGDRIDRATAQQAQRTGEAVSGMELGPLGTLTLRTVMPYRANDGQVLGYFELGKEIGEVIDTIHEILGVDVVVLVDKRRLDREGWDAGRQLFHRSMAWDTLAQTVVTDSTLAELPAPLIRSLAEIAPNGPAGPADVTANGRDLHLTALPLIDAAGAQIGLITVIADLTPLKAASRVLFVGVAAVSVAIGGVLLLVFSRILGRVENRVHAAFGGLARSNADMERVAYIACHDLHQAAEDLVDAAQSPGGGGGPIETVTAKAVKVRDMVEMLEDYFDLEINARREPVSLDAVVAAAIDKIGLAAGTAAIEVDPLPVLPVRPVAFARSVLCIIQAALDPPADGCRRRLRIAAAQDGDRWRISFADDGSGDSPARQAAITEARRLGEWHGGDLQASETPGGGRVLTLVLPA